MTLSPEALLIDFDGTLVNTVPPLYDVYRRFLVKHGATASPTDFAQYNGIAIANMVKDLVRA